MSGGRFCDDCGHGCRERCIFVSADEQPWFECYRIARRILPGEPWKTWEYSTWIRGEWAAFCGPRSIPDHHRRVHQDAFHNWLLARHGHPASTPAAHEAAA